MALTLPRARSRSGTVVSPVTTGGYVQGGGVVRQTPTQEAAMYTQAVAMGATATRVYDAAANCTTVPPILTCGAVTLAAAQVVGMYGAAQRSWLCGVRRNP